MSLTEPVADFYEVLGPFYDFVAVDKKKKNGEYMNGNAMIPEDRDVSSTANFNCKQWILSSLNACSNNLCLPAIPTRKQENDSSEQASGHKGMNGLTNGVVHECESEGEEFSDTYDHISEVIL